MTHSVRHHAAAVFGVDMIGAFVLEYVTGAMLEQWFHIKL